MEGGTHRLDGHFNVNLYGLASFPLDCHNKGFWCEILQPAETQWALPSIVNAERKGTSLPFLVGSLTSVPISANAVLTTTIRLRFDRRSTACQISLSHSDVTRAADPLAAVTLTYYRRIAQVQTAGIKFIHRPKIRLFAPQGRLVAPIDVGPLGCGKFRLNRCSGWESGPKISKISTFW